MDQIIGTGLLHRRAQSGFPGLWPLAFGFHRVSWGSPQVEAGPLQGQGGLGEADALQAARFPVRRRFDGSVL